LTGLDKHRPAERNRSGRHEFLPHTRLIIGFFVSLSAAKNLNNLKMPGAARRSEERFKLEADFFRRAQDSTN
jgi:hypothetical protein